MTTTRTHADGTTFEYEAAPQSSECVVCHRTPEVVRVSYPDGWFMWWTTCPPEGCPCWYRGAPGETREQALEAWEAQWNRAPPCPVCGKEPVLVKRGSGWITMCVNVECTGKVGFHSNDAEHACEHWVLYCMDAMDDPFFRARPDQRIRTDESRNDPKR